MALTPEGKLNSAILFQADKYNSKDDLCNGIVASSKDTPSQVIDPVLNELYPAVA